VGKGPSCSAFAAQQPAASAAHLGPRQPTQNSGESSQKEGIMPPCAAILSHISYMLSFMEKNEIQGQGLEGVGPGPGWGSRELQDAERKDPQSGAHASGSGFWTWLRPVRCGHVLHTHTHLCLSASVSAGMLYTSSPRSEMARTLPASTVASDARRRSISIAWRSARHNLALRCCCLLSQTLPAFPNPHAASRTRAAA
jgi:hypothetical protein